MGETARSGDGKLRLARLYLDLGRLDEAEAMARAAVEQHERAHVDSSEAGAALARVLVATGKIGEARMSAAADVELSGKYPELAIARLNKALAARLPEVPHRFDAELLLARALLAAGRSRDAESRLRAIAAEARQKGFVLVEKAALEKR
jgi:thioredoxin-like negative regulator of GroEL